MAKLAALKAHRERQALSQRELGALASATQTTISRLEGGHDARPATIRKLAKALKVRPIDLMAEPAETAKEG